MDRFFTNELDLNDWLNAAKNLRESLTDSIIEASVKQPPPEIFNVSGPELVSKIKSRRDQLTGFTTEYYVFLAKEVEVTGSRKKEYFEVKKINADDVHVKVFRVNAEGKKNDTTFYSRVFKAAETKEIRLYGISGEDIYTIEGDINTIRLRIIGGAGRDSVVEVGGSHHFDVYNGGENFFHTT